MGGDYLEAAGERWDQISLITASQTLLSTTTHLLCFEDVYLTGNCGRLTQNPD